MPSEEGQWGPMAKHRICTMSFASVYPHYIAKAECGPGSVFWIAAPKAGLAQ